jgi:hypothetical protein
MNPLYVAFYNVLLFLIAGLGYVGAYYSPLVENIQPLISLTEMQTSLTNFQALVDFNCLQFSTVTYTCPNGGILNGTTCKYYAVPETSISIPICTLPYTLSSGVCTHTVAATSTPMCTDGYTYNAELQNCIMAIASAPLATDVSVTLTTINTPVYKSATTLDILMIDEVNSFPTARLLHGTDADASNSTSDINTISTPMRRERRLVTSLLVTQATVLQTVVDKVKGKFSMCTVIHTKKSFYGSVLTCFFLNR